MSNVANLGGSTPSGPLDRPRLRLGGKSIWEWLDLISKLAIPLILGIATLLFGMQQAYLADLQHQSDLLSALNQQRQATLVTYLDNMKDLLLNRGILTSKPDDEIRIIALTETLSAMRQLDGKRNGYLTQFLQDARLIGSDIAKDYNIVSFEGADLSSIGLSTANLRGVNLSHANLRDAWFLSQAQLNPVSTCKDAILPPGLICHNL